jgi:phage-related protein
MSNEVDIIINSKNNSSDGFKNASKEAKEYGSNLEGVGERADNAEARTLGLKDTVDGVATIMAGPGKQGIAAYLQGWADLASGVANFVIPSLIQVATAEGRAAIATGLATARTWAANAATKAYAAGQWLLNAALSANPIGLIIIGLIALGVALVVAYKKSATFRTIVQGAFRVVQAAGRVLWSAIKTYFQAIGAAMQIASRVAQSVASRVRSIWSGIVSFIRSVPGRIRGALGGMFNPIINSARNAYNYAVGLLRNLVNYARSIPSQIGNSIKGMLPGFEHGGVVGQAASGATSSGLTMTGERGPELLDLPPGTRVRTNSDSRRMMGNGGSNGETTLRIIVEGTGILKGMRKEVQAQFGGNVQLALGKN